MRRFYISPDQIKQKESLITGSDAHHLKTVLRLNTGDLIVVFDGQGREFQGRISNFRPDGVQISLVSQLTPNTESHLTLTLAQGYLKDKKMDPLVRPLTEMGIHQWIPFRAKRSVAVPNQARFLARHARWEKLTQEAVKQCGRCKPMVIEPAASFADVLKLSRPFDLKLIFHEKTQSISLAQYQGHPSANMLILIGPEGGFAPEEVAMAEQAGFGAVGMGPRVLRAETAALAAAALVQYVFGDWGPLRRD